MFYIFNYNVKFSYSKCFTDILHINYYNYLTTVFISINIEFT